MKDVYLPIILRLEHASERSTFESLYQDRDTISVYDEIFSQLKELIKISHPSRKIAEEEYPLLIEEHLAGRRIEEYGVWVYYPWSRRLVHLLDEDEFVEVRTNRNRNKITREEQDILRAKKIGVGGLSVGQSIALTLAMERTCGEIRLADFDTAELSNLNRIRAGVHNLGLSKTIIAAREIAEIDPFIKVRIFNDGLTENNLSDIFLSGGKLDLFVEVCDGIQMKLTSRLKAKELQIPVVMDTNDRGMLDVERFDLEPERPILHGFLEHFIGDGAITVTDENRGQIVGAILNFETLSERMKLSMAEIGKTINTWPQLASSVVLGGAITTDICRRILLDQHSASGRYYVDLDELLKD
ncbi:ThiF family adenylyltransferase [Pedobacter sp. SYSU D00535]|uniref:ThiF family adenylyltransferase n=1 Tax=Pedobacter sp. SYSU D00535 TaxID=2810308 RepID=UPI001A960EF2|nr:ThiF family adenylyltransferase [Pedobacter sp. SYSU D00535]